MSERLPNFILVLWLTSLIYFHESLSVEVNKTLSLIISSRRNQTGHLISQAFLSNDGSRAPDQWTVKIQQSSIEHTGMQSFHLIATFIAQPPVPADYELFPGVGYYKFHSTNANGFEDASLQCALEGGHLAIVNSESEHQVLQTMFARHPESQLKVEYAYIGFHDRLKEGEFFTIFGQPLQSTGFTRWSHPNQPDDQLNNEDCGSVHRNGGLNDIPCQIKLPFICEYDLSWMEN